MVQGSDLSLKKGGSDLSTKRALFRIDKFKIYPQTDFHKILTYFCIFLRNAQKKKEKKNKSIVKKTKMISRCIRKNDRTKKY